MRTAMILLAATAALLLAGCPDDDDDSAASDDDDAFFDDDDAADDDDATDDDDAADDDDATDDDDAVDDDDAAPDCEGDPTGWIGVCGWEDSFPWGIELTGSFGAIDGSGQADFTTGGGDVWEIDFGSSPGGQAALPDLAAAGTVTVRLDGNCDGKGGAYSQVLVETIEATPRLVLLASNLQAAGGAGWLVEAPRDVATCPGTTTDEGSWCGCFETCHVKPVLFTRGGDTWSLQQGQSETLADVRITVLRAYSGVDTKCSDVGQDNQSWLVAGLEWLN
jgi:hypothetical protein